MKDLIIIGAGNVGGFLALNQELFKEAFNIIGFLDDDENKHNSLFWGINVLGGVDQIHKYKDVPVAIGISNSKVKEKILTRIGKDYHFPSFISKNAWISNKVNIGQGVIIYPGVSINHESEINDFVIINMNCAIGHDTIIGKGSALAPGVNFGGFTNVGEFVDVGIGASTVQNIKIGDGARIGGQAMLISDVEPYATYVGVPGKKND